MSESLTLAALPAAAALEQGQNFISGDGSWIAANAEQERFTSLLPAYSRSLKSY